MRHDAALLILIDTRGVIVNLLFYVLFFGIFHTTGGLALGKGIRELVSGTQRGGSLALWGTVLGGTPIIFDWFFLIREGEMLAGFAGPTIFFLSTMIGGFFLKGDITKKNEKSYAAILMGGTAVMLGGMLIPYLLTQAQTQDNLSLVDYVCGGSIPLFFILIGFSFAYNGFIAIRKKRTFDEQVAEYEAEDTGRKGK